MGRSRRGRGEGAVYRRDSDGLWVGSVSCGYKANGKRNRRMVYGHTKADVLKALARLKGESTITDAAGLSVRTYLDRWLKDAKSQTLSAESLAKYRAILETHVNPVIGHLLLSRVGAIQVQGVYSAMARNGSSGTSRKIAHVVLKQAFRQAVTWRLIPVNPADGVEAPRADTEHIHPLESEADVKALLSAAKEHRLWALLVLAVHSGARAGELISLTWQDVDFAGGRITISKTKKAGGSGRTKTRASRRTVNVPPVAIKALESHRKTLLREGLARCPLVFPNQSGNQLNYATISDCLHSHLAAAGLKAIRFHDLRHTHATLLLKAGVHPRVVQERLGHASVTITMDTYSHVLPSMQADVSRRLGKMLG